MHYRNFLIIFLQIFLQYKKVNIKESITEMYPQIPWEVVADNLGSAEHIFGTNEVNE